MDTPRATHITVPTRLAAGVFPLEPHRVVTEISHNQGALQVTGNMHIQGDLHVDGKHVSPDIQHDLDNLRRENVELRQELSDMRTMLMALWYAPGMPGETVTFDAFRRHLGQNVQR